MRPFRTNVVYLHNCLWLFGVFHVIGKGGHLNMVVLLIDDKFRINVSVLKNYYLQKCIALHDLMQECGGMSIKLGTRLSAETI